MDFGKRLKELMSRANLTRYALAKASGVSYSFIADLESGRSRKPSPEILARLAGPLGVSYESLLADAGYPPPEMPARLPEWLKTMPKDVQQFVEREAEKGWPYLRVLIDASERGLPPEDLRQVLLALMDFAKRRERDRK